MIKFAIERQVQATDEFATVLGVGHFVEVAEGTRRYKEALAELAALIEQGDAVGVYRIRLGRRVWHEQVVAPSLDTFGVGDVIRTPRGTRDGKVWKVEDGVLFYYSLLPDGGIPLNSPTRKVLAAKATLVQKAASAAA
jgi:hypothetical protein